jgi:hypothetical protein
VIDRGPSRPWTTRVSCRLLASADAALRYVVPRNRVGFDNLARLTTNCRCGTSGPPPIPFKLVRRGEWLEGKARRGMCPEPHTGEQAAMCSVRLGLIRG